MFRNLLPKEFAFFDYFDDMMGKCNELSNVLLRTTKNEIPFEDGVKQIKKYEKAMDAVEVTIIEALHMTFITPLERPDILKLAHTIDAIADNINSAISRLFLYQLELRPDLVVIADNLVKATDELKTAVKALRDFKEPEVVKAKCAAIRKFESESDDIFKKALVDIFATNDAMYVIKYKEIYEKFEKAMNKCEDTANIIEEILIESA